MDRKQALAVVKRHLNDDELVQALAVLAGSPPWRLGGLQDEADRLANLIHKTGSNPGFRSVAMEMLIHRLTCLLEAFLGVYQDAREKVQ